MNLVKMSKDLTMSSREIAELCRKRHDHVVVDVEKMFSELGINAPEFSGTYKTSQGNRLVAVLGKELPGEDKNVLKIR